jgi:tRNA-specific 2-thiouridylase
MDYYNNSYEAGLTPNPCVECNRYVKWEKLVEYAKNQWDVDYIATGHYAQIDRTGDSPRVFRSRDERKDQTYMMTRVYPKDIEYALFPLGHLTKPEVVEIAKAADLPTAHSKESQDICFVLDGHANYMKGVFGVRKGPIVDLDTGKVVGEHEGYFHYTLGQRKGVKVAAGRPIYVVKVDPKPNTVYVGDKEHLETQELRVLDINWLHPCFEISGLETPVRFSLEVMAKIRYNSQPSRATVYPDPENPRVYTVKLHTPQMAVTPGQICALYDTDYNELWGGGYIESYLQHKAFDPEQKKDLPNLFCDLV